MQKVLKVSKNLKWQYSIFNFFAPIVFAAILINTLEIYSVKGTLFGFLSLILGICLCAYNLKRYKRRLYINDEKISILEGTDKKPKLIAEFSKEEFEKFNVKNERDGISVYSENKTTKVLNIFPSLSGIILLFGLLTVILVPIIYTIKNYYRNSVKSLIEEKEPEKESGAEIVCHVIFWTIDIFLAFLGLIGILLIIFYPFMNQVQQ